MKAVDGPDEAIAHIAACGTQHTEAILTETPPWREDFLARGRQRHPAAERLDPVRRRRRISAGAEIGIATGSCTPAARVGAAEPTAHKMVVRRQRPDQAPAGTAKDEGRRFPGGRFAYPGRTDVLHGSGTLLTPMMGMIAGTIAIRSPSL